LIFLKEVKINRRRMKVVCQTIPLIKNFAFRKVS